MARLRHAAGAVEVGEQAGDGGEAGAEEGRPAVDGQLPEAEYAVAGAEGGRKQEVTAVTGHSVGSVPDAAISRPQIGRNV